MRSVYIHTIILVFFSFLGNSQTYELNIIDGWGNGTYEAEAEVHIWSKKPKANEVFSHWVGQGSEYILRPLEWHSTINVPTNSTFTSIELKAVFIDLENIIVGDTVINQFGEYNESGQFVSTQKEILFAYPEQIKAVVFMIHGTGGKADSWFNRFEKQSIIKDLLAANYAVFALNSNETTLGDQDGNGTIQWENSAFKSSTNSNIDFKNVESTITFARNFLNLDDEPFYLIGGSNGANFSDYCSAVLDIKASAHLTGNGLNHVFNNQPNLKPIIWIQAFNDNNGSADSTQAKNNYQILLDKGITTEWYWHYPSPLYPARFRRSLNNIDLQLSTQIFNRLTSLGYLDQGNYLNIKNVNLELDQDALFAGFNMSNAQQSDVIDQLNSANADHGANGDFNKTIIEFFNSCLVNKNNETTAPKFVITPNPSKDVFHVIGPDIDKLELYNMDGELTRVAFSREMCIDDLRAGLYPLIVLSKWGRKTMIVCIMK